MNQKRYNSIVLYQLVKKICNRLTTITGKDVIENFIEALCNIVLIRGDEYNSVPKYLETSKYRFEVLSQIEIDLTLEALYDTYIRDLIYRG